MSHHRYRRLRVLGVGRISELGKQTVSYIRQSGQLHDAPTLAMQLQCLRERQEAGMEPS